MYCRRLASPGSETGGPLQHPVAQEAKTGIVSPGFDRPVPPPSTAEDQAAHRQAISSCRGKTSARVAREGRRDRQDRAHAQRVIAWVRSGVTTACRERRFVSPPNSPVRWSVSSTATPSKCCTTPNPERIRLSGIDCPENGQAYGKRAKQALSALVFGRDVILQTHGQDKYGRTLADVFLSDGTNVNHELVKAGWCWWYRKYAPVDKVLEELERKAREARKGLWADPQPVPPWEWRKRSR